MKACCLVLLLSVAVGTSFAQKEIKPYPGQNAERDKPLLQQRYDEPDGRLLRDEHNGWILPAMILPDELPTVNHRVLLMSPRTARLINAAGSFDSLQIFARPLPLWDFDLSREALKELLQSRRNGNAWPAIRDEIDFTQPHDPIERELRRLPSRTK
jgi:hypothetical protein